MVSHCKLNSTPQSKTVNGDLDSALIEAVERPEVQISNKSVNTHVPCRPVRQHARRGTSHFPAPQPSNTLLDGGHTREVGANIGRCEKTMAWEEEASTQPHAERYCAEFYRRHGWQAFFRRRTVLHNIEIHHQG